MCLISREISGYLSRDHFNSMLDKLSFLLVFLLAIQLGFGQSFEVMPGTERMFIDAQFLSFFDQQKKVSLFARARATTEYNRSTTDLFTGAYVNYTTKYGIGGTVIGRVASSNAGLDAGLHYFKAGKKLMIYTLQAISLNSDLLSSFSIIRYTPILSSSLKLYTSIELFSAFGRAGHLGSVQRVRLGLDKTGLQFGLAINLSWRGKKIELVDSNPGLFLRKQF